MSEADNTAFVPPPLPHGDYARLVYVDARGSIFSRIARISAAEVAGVALMKIEIVEYRELSAAPFYLGGASIALLETLTRDQAQLDVDSFYSGSGR